MKRKQALEYLIQMYNQLGSKDIIYQKEYKEAILFFVDEYKRKRELNKTNYKNRKKESDIKC